mmetsp:Transcript_21483/g.71178  ORF Transcript_21483/g.71178 Transcript_21483/m.71178 type:complete len:228 (-) Transcript_21483:528-1211(-)
MSFRIRKCCQRIWRHQVRRLPFSTSSQQSNDVSTMINSILSLPTSHDERMQLVEMEEQGDHARLKFALPSQVFRKSRETVLRSWGHYFGNRGFDRQPKLDYKNKRLMTMLTAAYTGPLTILKGLEVLQIEQANESVEKRRLEIHVVGAASQEETLLFTYWIEIGALLPHCNIRLHLIGPELSARAIIHPNITLCSNLAASLHQCSYDEFLANKKLRSSEVNLCCFRY